MTMPNKQLGSSSIAWNLIWCRSLGNLSSHFVVVVAHFGHGEILSHASTVASRKCNYEPNVHFILIKNFVWFRNDFIWHGGVLLWGSYVRIEWCATFCHEKYTNQMMKRERHIWISLGTFMGDSLKQFKFF